MVTIDSSIDKTLIPAMPQVTFPGTITVVDTPEGVADALRYLSRCRIVGLDTETRPSFKKGVVYKTALLQLSSSGKAFLFRLNILGLPAALCDFLANPRILKVGLSLKDDFGSLRRHASVSPDRYVELQEMAGQMGIREKGLQRMYALLFGKRISKSQQLSNWEAETLSDAQCQYAAIDAWACVRIYKYLNGLLRSGDYQVIDRDAEESIIEEG